MQYQDLSTNHPSTSSTNSNRLWLDLNILRTYKQAIKYPQSVNGKNQWMMKSKQCMNEKFGT